MQVTSELTFLLPGERRGLIVMVLSPRLGTGRVKLPVHAVTQVDVPHAGVSLGHLPQDKQRSEPEQAAQEAELPTGNGHAEDDGDRQREQDQFTIAAQKQM